jgi:hypothetical protein
MPTAVLDARDRDSNLGLPGNEDGHVEDPVLFRAEQFLTVVEEHRGVERVGCDQLRYGTCLIDLLDSEAERQRILHGEVIGTRGVARDSGAMTTPRSSAGSPSWMLASIMWTPFFTVESTAKAHLLT